MRENGLGRVLSVGGGWREDGRERKPWAVMVTSDGQSMHVGHAILLPSHPRHLAVPVSNPFNFPPPT